MTYCPKPRIVNSMISTARTGAPSKRVRAFHLPDGKERGELRADRRRDRRREASISAISILAALAAAPPEGLTLETCSVARADPLGVVIVVKMEKPSWSCHLKKRIAADDAPCNYRRPKPVRRVMARA